MNAGAVELELGASVGRLKRYKSKVRVITMLRLVLAERPDVRRSIIDTGPFGVNLRKHAEELGISERVEIRVVPPTESSWGAQELSRTALGNLPNDSETHLVVALESISLGLHMLAADRTNSVNLH
jgi:glycosyltransferase involved in cell wall biosynthesis